MKSEWTTSDLHKIYRLNNRQILTVAESSSRIPKAGRKKRGASTVRYWPTGQLPEIGRVFGPYKEKPSKMVIIAVYIKKGGVFKTTFTYTLGRMLALSGLRVLISGLDSQQNLTNLALNPLYTYESLAQLKVNKGLYELLISEKKSLKLEDIIVPTSLPTLDIIPENYNLSKLADHIQTMHANDQIFKNHISDPSRDLGYDVLLFDNSPGWNRMAANSIYASDFIISPAACEPACYQSLEFYIKEIYTYLNDVNKKILRHFLIPTNLEKTNKLSTAIQAYYRQNFSDICTASSIRRTIKGAEAYVYGQTPIEVEPSSALSDDYQLVIDEVWKEIMKCIEA